MPVDIKNFVDINIQKAVASTVIGSRDTAVLFTIDTVPAGDKTYSAYIAGDITGATADLTNEYVQTFFNNGGVKLRVINYVSTLTKTNLTNLDNKYICIAAVGTTFAQMKTLAQAMNSDTTIYGINEKLLFTSTSTSTPDTDEVKNLIVQYSGDLTNTTGTTTYCDAQVMAIMAYLTKINVYAERSIFDYMFTENKVLAKYSLVDMTNTAYQNLIDANYNVDIYLASAIRAMGGNTKNGLDLVNEYVRIILHQTLTEQLVTLLSQKLKSVNAQSKIYSTISSELNRYLFSGYLTTDKVYENEDWTVVRNNVEYTICEKGTALQNGYIIKILPFSQDDLTAHKTPPIYILLADQVGIRKIKIDGQVI